MKKRTIVPFWRNKYDRALKAAADLTALALAVRGAKPEAADRIESRAKELREEVAAAHRAAIKRGPRFRNGFGQLVGTVWA